MDFYVVMKRRGYRVANRRRCQGKIGKQHRVVKADTQEWFKRKYDGIILKHHYVFYWRDPSPHPTTIQRP